MWQAFSFAFNAVMPMLLLMCVGYWLKRKGLFDKETLKRINNFGFKYSLTLLVFSNVYSIKTLQDIPIVFAITIIVALIILTLLGVFFAHILTRDDKQRGVIVQNSFRSNYNVIGVPMALQLGGVAGSEVGAAIMAPVVLYYNIVSVLALTYYGQGSSNNSSLKKILVKVLKNPLIIALIIGLGCLAVRGVMPCNAEGEPIFLFARDIPWVYKAITDMGKIAPPLLIILLGASINFSKIGEIKKLLSIGVAMRIVLAPIIGYEVVFLAQGFGVMEVNTTILAAMVGVFASPATPVSAIMADDAGCDGELAAQIVVWTTVFSMFTMLVLIMICKYLKLM